jgi:RHS repeat-associated protein
VANYEYGPFGEVIRATGPMAKANPIRFSTKYQDNESDLVYYGYRYYDPSMGKWLSRDPAGEGGGQNIYGMVGNDPLNAFDALGLWATKVHHQIVEDWLGKRTPDYHNYPWHCCKINVIKLLEHGSDLVDGVGWAGWPHWCDAQSSRLAYQHAMRDGAHGQTVAQAQSQYDIFLLTNIKMAFVESDLARESGNCKTLRKALVFLGRAYHSYSDSLSPAHHGFQPWWGPIDGVMDMGPLGYWHFVQEHESKETMSVYETNSPAIVSSVGGEFDSDLSYVLKQ